MNILSFIGQAFVLIFGTVYSLLTGIIEESPSLISLYQTVDGIKEAVLAEFLGIPLIVVSIASVILSVIHFIIAIYKKN